MSAEIQFRFFGWCFNKSNNNDKIWGWFTIGERVYNFWGPRGASKLIKIRFKEINDYAQFRYNEEIARDKTRDKLKKDYRSIDLTVENDQLVEVEKVYPGFTDHLKKQMFIAKLSGKIMGAE